MQLVEQTIIDEDDPRFAEIDQATLMLKPVFGHDSNPPAARLLAQRADLHAGRPESSRVGPAGGTTNLCLRTPSLAHLRHPPDVRSTAAFGG